MYTETIRFEEVFLTASKTVKCAGGCGRRLKRKRRFSQTINPWNKDENGKLKGRSQIYAELRRDIDKWEQEPDTCQHCKDGEQR
jgi:hypothetical protein